VRQMRSALAMKSGPLVASRQAAVAIAQTRPTFMDVAQRAEAPQRRQRLGDASGASRPVVCTSRPSPHSAFSLKIGVGLRVIALIDDETHRVRADVDDRDAGRP
jgi:hypothetical protein